MKQLGGWWGHGDMDLHSHYICCGPVNPWAPLKVLWVIGSQCISKTQWILFTPVHWPVQLWLDHLRWVFKPSVTGVLDIQQRINSLSIVNVDASVFCEAATPPIDPLTLGLSIHPSIHSSVYAAINALRLSTDVRINTLHPCLPPASSMLQ